MRDRGWKWAGPAAWIIGLGALLCDHLEASEWLVVLTRALFAMATCAAICLVLISRARALASISSPELYLFTRLVSRWVYISMYLLALVRVGFYMYDVSQHCTHHGPACARPVQPLDDFQFYVACCVIPLWMVRALVLALPFGNSSEPRVLP